VAGSTRDTFGLQETRAKSKRTGKIFCIVFFIRKVKNLAGNTNYRGCSLPLRKLNCGFKLANYRLWISCGKHEVSGYQHICACPEKLGGIGLVYAAINFNQRS
jgi:hypothetical protein